MLIAQKRKPPNSCSTAMTSCQVNLEYPLEISVFIGPIFSKEIQEMYLHFVYSLEIALIQALVLYF